MYYFAPLRAYAGILIVEDMVHMSEFPEMQGVDYAEITGWAMPLGQIGCMQRVLEADLSQEESIVPWIGNVGAMSEVPPETTE